MSLNDNFGCPGTYRKFPRSEMDQEPHLLQFDVEAASAAMQPSTASKLWKIRKAGQISLWIAIFLLLGYELFGLMGKSHRTDSAHNISPSIVTSNASTSSESFQAQDILNASGTTLEPQTTKQNMPPSTTTDQPSSTVFDSVTIAPSQVEMPIWYEDPYEIPRKQWCPDWMPKEMCDWYASGSTMPPPTTSTRFPFVQREWTPVILMPDGKCPHSKTFCDWLRTLKTEPPMMSEEEEVLGSDD